MLGKMIQNKGLGTIRKLNKNGIPVFDRNEDIFNVFKELSDRDMADEKKQNMASKDQSLHVCKKESTPNNKHGLPILSRSISLAGIFAQKEQNVEEDFPAMLAQSLAEKDGGALLREKREKELPDPVPIQRRLKRYPSPQYGLDLHGDTAVRAVVRSESFLRTAWRAGDFTVSIVVGRGLHSEFGAVLPDVVEDLLIKLKKEGVVLWFEWERKVKSRSGAVIVYLKQF